MHNTHERKCERTNYVQTCRGCFLIRLRGRYVALEWQLDRYNKGTELNQRTAVQLEMSVCLCLCCVQCTDKPEVQIVVEFPEGLTREGENLELTCKAKGKPLWVQRWALRPLYSFHINLFGCFIMQIIINDNKNNSGRYANKYMVWCWYFILILHLFCCFDRQTHTHTHARTHNR